MRPNTEATMPDVKETASGCGPARSWLSLMAGVVVACVPSPHAGTPGNGGFAERDLLQAVRTRVDSASAERARVGMRSFEFVADSVEFRQEKSKAIPGLVYRWATYRPPGTFDVFFAALQGRRDSTVRVLDSPLDWWQLVDAIDWKPENSQDVMLACYEIVEYVGPRRDIAIRPIPYLGPNTLAQMFAVDRDSLLKAGISPPRPVSSLPDSVWSVSFWALEGGQTTHYTCELGGKGNTTLTVADSIYGVGLQPRGP